MRRRINHDYEEMILAGLYMGGDNSGKITTLQQIDNALATLKSLASFRFEYSDNIKSLPPEYN